MADDNLDKLVSQLGTPRKEYNLEQSLRDVIRATEDGQVFVALAFLNGMLAAITMRGKK